MPPAAISIFISCRRERTIERAAKLRTMQRRSDVPVQEESKWRQMYSARMQVCNEVVVGWIRVAGRVERDCVQRWGRE